MVLDASALLALLQQEPGQMRATHAVESGAVISSVNLSEVAAKLRDIGVSEAVVQQAVAALVARGLEVVDFDGALALVAAFLRPATRTLGLSLGDRACLALGKQRGEPVLTTDRAWASLPPSLGVEVEVIR